VRADIFVGFGPAGARRAGVLKGTVARYVLLPKAPAAKIGDAHTYPPNFQQ
jgi:membrane-bound lytic murein transglycosylase